MRHVRTILVHHCNLVATSYLLGRDSVHHPRRQDQTKPICPVTVFTRGMHSALGHGYSAHTGRLNQRNDYTHQPSVPHCRPLQAGQQHRHGRPSQRHSLPAQLQEGSSSPQDRKRHWLLTKHGTLQACGLLAGAALVPVLPALALMSSSGSGGNGSHGGSGGGDGSGGEGPSGSNPVCEVAAGQDDGCGSGTTGLTSACMHPTCIVIFWQELQGSMAGAGSMTAIPSRRNSLVMHACMHDVT